MSDWKPHFYQVGPSAFEANDDPSSEAEDHRKKIEPWLSAVFQSEHLSLLVANGLSIAVSAAFGARPGSMDKAKFTCELADNVNSHAEASAKRCGRLNANIEDQIRAANQLIAGLEIAADARAGTWRKALDSELAAFLGRILTSEAEIKAAVAKQDEKAKQAEAMLVSFLLSFASRAASRERLNLFNTNYDRIVEFGCDRAGLHILDRFVGHLCPVFRASRLSLDLHYNPPGIRGEPRYMEGVVRLTKLHGSLDWRWERQELHRYGIPFGAPVSHPDMPKNPLESVIIYPNPAKDVETLDYPYAELFRDFCAALCRPNSALVTYGYGFGDDHINRVIRDMLTIPSTHLVIIAYGDPDKRIQHFCETVGRQAQISVLFGKHFGNLSDLVEHYLPKPAIDLITTRQADLLKNRGITTIPIVTAPTPTATATS